VQLDLFARLARGPLTPAALAAATALPPAAADRLLAAAAALQLTERRGAAYGLGPLGAAMVDNPAVAAMVRHHASVYLDLADPVALLRAGRGRLGEYWGYAGADSPESLRPDQVEAYSTLMSASQPLVAAEVLDAYDVRRHRVLMDVGGGEGTFLLSAAARAPSLRLVLFDLPAVADRARARFAESGLAARASAVGGDAFRDALPGGADLISLVRVVHDHDDAAAMTLLRAVRAALAPGGTLLLAEPMAEAPGARRVGDAYFGMYLLAMGSGRARSAARLRAMLAEAGFRSARPRRTATPLQTGLIVARA
jgi:demethylspheroidene O-methyltransferase